MSTKTAFLLISLTTLLQPINAQDIKMSASIRNKGDECLFYLYQTGSSKEISLAIDQYGELRYTVSGPSTFEYSDYYDNTNGQLIKVNDTEYEYYTDINKDGKVARVGDIKINYYDQYMGDERSGKISAIGDIRINYYVDIDGKAKVGKISEIGGIRVDYYYGFDNEGKISAIGNYSIRYHMQIQGQGRSGKVAQVSGFQKDIAIEFEM